MKKLGGFIRCSPQVYESKRFYYGIDRLKVVFIPTIQAITEIMILFDLYMN